MESMVPIGETTITGVLSIGGLEPQPLLQESICTLEHLLKRIENRRRDENQDNIKFYKEQTDTKRQQYSQKCKMKLSTFAVHESYQRSGLGTVLLQKAVEMQDEEGKDMWVSAMPASQGVLRRFGFDIETELIEGPVNYLHGFGARRHAL